MSRASPILPPLLLFAVACSSSGSNSDEGQGHGGSHPASGGTGGATAGAGEESAGALNGGGGAAPAGGRGGAESAGALNGGGGAAPAHGGSAALGGAGAGGKPSYVTDFDLTESPISEQGAWTRRGLDWTQVNVASGRAFGTHSGAAYNDSYAHLSGFSPDVEVSTVIYLDDSIGSNYHEVEILLRWSDAAHDAHGYECNLNYAGGYAEIVRWNGPFGDYTYIGGGQGAGGGHKPVNGSIFKASIRGNLITTSLDGVVLQTADITAVSGPVWADGDPGMGFFNGESGKYGFQSYVAIAL